MAILSWWCHGTLNKLLTKPTSIFQVLRRFISWRRTETGKWEWTCCIKTGVIFTLLTGRLLWTDPTWRLRFYELPVAQSRFLCSWETLRSGSHHDWNETCVLTIFYFQLKCIKLQFDFEASSNLPVYDLVYFIGRSFKIGPASENYTLSIDGYSGSATDSMKYHNRRPFSTKDRDNDDAHANCASRHNKGGWWYHNCAYSNLNGVFGEDGWEGIAWFDNGRNRWMNLRFTEMRMRKNK